MTDDDKVMNPQHFGRVPTDIRIRIRMSAGCGLLRQSGMESQITFGWNFGVGGGLRSLSTVLFHYARWNDRFRSPSGRWCGWCGWLCSRYMRDITASTLSLSAESSTEQCLLHELSVRPVRSRPTTVSSSASQDLSTLMCSWVIIFTTFM